MTTLKTNLTTSTSEWLNKYFIGTPRIYLSNGRNKLLKYNNLHTESNTMTPTCLWAHAHILKKTQFPFGDSLTV